MPIIAAAATAAALAAQAAPQIETSMTPIEGGRIVRLTHTELASVTTRPAGPYVGNLSTPDLQLYGAAYAGSAGMRTIAVSNGVGSASQAMGSVNVQVTIRESSK
jgi:hypothetical protein